MHATHYNSLRKVGGGRHSLQLMKKEIRRLPAPYRSRCKDEGNLFSNINTATSRHETCALNYMLQECGAVVDRWRKYAPKKTFPIITHRMPMILSLIKSTLGLLLLRYSAVVLIGLSKKPFKALLSLD